MAYCDKCDWYLAANVYGTVRAAALSHEKSHRHTVVVSDAVYTATCQAHLCLWTTRSATLQGAQSVGRTHEDSHKWA